MARHFREQAFSTEQRRPAGLTRAEAILDSSGLARRPRIVFSTAVVTSGQAVSFAKWLLASSRKTVDSFPSTAMKQLSDKGAWRNRLAVGQNRPRSGLLFWGS